MENDNRTWTDQPDVVAGLPVSASLYLRSRSVEIRKAAGGAYYVTQGNLFGSETLFCKDADAMLRALQVIGHAGDKPVEVPQGCVVVSNALSPEDALRQARG